MRNLAIVLAVAVLATYAFIAVNERQKERAIRLRLPKFRKINKYEFDKSLYQVRETRAKRLKETSRRNINQTDTNAKEDFYRDYEYLENLKNAPSTEVLPIQEPSIEYPAQPAQPQEENNIQQPAQEDAMQPAEQQPELPIRPIRQLRHYRQLPQADTNNENM